MTVKELFQKANTKAIADAIAADNWKLKIDNSKSEAEKDVIRRCMSKRIQDAFEKILKIETELENDKLIRCVRVQSLDEEDSYIDACMLYKDDVIHKEIYEIDYDDKERELVEMDEYEKRFIQSYAFEFESWNKILGWEVAEVSVYEYGIDAVAEAIFNEMTFFGLDQDDAATRVENEIKLLEKQAKEIKENPVNGIPFESLMEELYNDLGLERPTPEEEEERRIRWKEEAKINQIETVRITRKIKEALLRE